MQRMTSKLDDFDQVLYVNKEGKHLTPAEISVGQTREVLQRLCEYEESGLSPEEIIKLKKSANIKRCQRKCNLINYGYTREDITKAIKRIKKIKT